MSSPTPRGSTPRRALSGVAVVALTGAMLAPLAASADDDAYLGAGSPAPESKIQDGGLTGADLVPNSYFVQLAAPATTEGGSPRVIQSQREQFLAHAQSAGVSVEVTSEYDTLWNGLAVTADAGSLTSLATSSVVEAIFPIGLIEAPERPSGGHHAPQMHSAVGMTGVDRAHELGYTGEGLRIGIIDTGVDYDHPDFGGGGTPDGDTFPTERVAYGYDFVGDSFNAAPSDPAYQPIPMPDEDPDDCQGHGTHVAGISSAGGEVVGVAPDSIIGAYRVFGCAGSTTAEIMLHAMEKSLEDDMDVVNLSIGSAFSSWAEYPTARATDALAREGVVVVASIGNSGANGLYSGGAPGVGRDTIGVGSVDNVSVRSNAFLDEDGEPVPYTTSTPAPTPPTEGTAQLLAFAEPGTTAAQHCEPFSEEEAAQIEGNWVLIQRGECTFHSKALNGQNAGAAGVVIYNNAAGALNASVAGDPPITVPVMGVMQQDGSRLATEALASDGVTITFTDEQAEAPNPSGGLMSSFSSFGTTADLMFKPDVSAPGGSIYAPYPLEDGGYATLSGTSMAAPHAAGAAALLLEAHPDLSVEDVKLRLQNSSTQVGLSIAPTAGLEVVHRQGSGLIQVDRAIEADVTAEPGLVQLGQQLAGETSTNTVTVHNHTGEEITYTVTHEGAVSTSGTANVFGYWLVEADVEHPESVTVPANGSAELTFDVTSPSLEGEEGDPMDPTFGGYLHLTEGEDSPAYSIAYGGSAFDLQDIEVLADMIDGDGNVTQELPALVTVESCAFWSGIDCVDPNVVYTPVDEDYVFTMAQGEHPVFAIHFEHQARNMTWEVFAANEDGTAGESLGTVSSVDYLARSSTRNAITGYAWDGMVMTDNGARERLPSGDYVMQIDVTKASAWNDDREPGVESYTSPAFTIDWSDEGLVDSPVVTRVEGHDRYATAAELAVTRFEPGVQTVFIANGLNFPDAVAGGALAVAEEGPVLLTRADELPGSTRMALRDLAPDRIVVLGGDTVVTDDVMEELADYTDDVDRVAGHDRYRTAAAISQEWESSDIVLIASGMDFPDALSAAAAAGVEGAPVLLTRQHGLPGATMNELERLDPSTIYVIGGETAVSQTVAEQAGGYADVVRLGGLDRYRTASTVAQEFFSSPTAEAFLATGRDFPDALAAAPAAALNGGPVLLTRPDSVPAATMTALDALRAQAITLVGGFDAIALQVQEGLGEYVYE
ncbi:S8 family serine peptidase [Ornithinimicrobium pratense]|uniref:S8 family serine peptidase n=1 Tax=Ornithinimicrobium pratense TaxID=2593973 RepID=A0A5J6V145_9MICO|nr:S8 family serine peptidase [Ornithinimicrobium pratense]QFG67389.1 S8 family serine peptidase [Ornithinimicrobium pratense]